MQQRIYHHELANGLVLLAEEMPWLESAAFALLLPAGAARDPAGRLGLANLTCEMLQRGCGQRDSRRFVEDLERLGAVRSASVGAAHMSFGASALSENLPDVLRIYADLVRAPHLPEDQLEDGRQVCLQEIRSVEDDPAQKVMELVREYHYPEPWGRPSEGRMQDVQAMTIEDVRQFYASRLGPRGAILSVAGRLDWPQLCDHVERLFGDWPAQTLETIAPKSARRGYHHVPLRSSQTHLAVAYPSVPYGHPDYFQARGAVGILSDGMSSRLFTEVREKRGLCYTVFASCHSLRDQGAVFCYASTNGERAQETLNVLLHELDRLQEGIETGELDRLKARVRSSLIMQQESSASRSLAMAGDWYHCGRVLPREEISQRIESLSVDSILGYLREHPPGDFTIATIGVKPLEVPCDLS